MPTDAYFTEPGFAFEAAMTSAKVFERPAGVRRDNIRGRADEKDRHQVVLDVDRRLVEDGGNDHVKSNVTRNVEPSGALLATCAAPSEPAAPDLFSTRTMRPSFVCRLDCRSRAMASVEPPGGKGTTSVIRLEDCAQRGRRQRKRLTSPAWPV